MKSTGGPAFPHGTAFKGMTLRDYFAAQALAIAYDHFSRDLEGDLNDHDVAWSEDMSLWAEAAYELADVMLKARGE